VIPVVVALGDTLSGIAAQHGTTWQALWADNSAIADPNLIYAGQTIEVPSGGKRVTLSKAPAWKPDSGGKVWGVTRGYPNFCGDGDNDGWDLPCTSLSAGPPAPAVAAPVVRSVQLVSAGAPGGFQACVISRESGGNAQVMNSTGHYGLYQFSASTWAAYGGSPSSFGNASVAQQNQVFASAMATPGGASNWSPYDGC
jgi:LysM repeat protein